MFLASQKVKNIYVDKKKQGTQREAVSALKNDNVRVVWRCSQGVFACYSGDGR